jgi:diketogulonate reductase-like aldo/keto reductase
VEYSLKVRKTEDGVLLYCDRNSIAVLAYRPLAHGTLASRPQRITENATATGWSLVQEDLARLDQRI